MMLPKIDQTVFNQNLLLTQVYCEMQLQKPFSNNAEVLRSINPEIDGEPVFSLEKKLFSNMSFCGSIWKEDPLSGSDLLYHDLFAKQLAYKNEALVGSDLETIYNGKILVAEVGCVVPDGASAEDSDFFIDDNDCPPIDTWFYKTYGQHGLILFAWIPEKFIPIVQSATQVNMLNTFNWFNDGAFFNDRYLLGI